MTQVILVDEQDAETGSLEKMEAHQKAVLHRAFSIFIFNSRCEMLLQQRATSKYHSGGLWTNACCSHPQPGEDTAVAAEKRLQEEMGFTTPLEEAFHFLYKVSFDNGLTEHEFDHVFIGTYDSELEVNPHEVKDYCFKTMDEIRSTIETHPQKYTEWFKIAFPKVEEYLATVTER